MRPVELRTARVHLLQPFLTWLRYYSNPRIDSAAGVPPSDNYTLALNDSVMSQLAGYQGMIDCFSHLFFRFLYTSWKVAYDKCQIMNREQTRPFISNADIFDRHDQAIPHIQIRGLWHSVVCIRWGPNGHFSNWRHWSAWFPWWYVCAYNCQEFASWNSGLFTTSRVSICHSISSYCSDKHTNLLARILADGLNIAPPYPDIILTRRLQGAWCGDESMERRATNEHSLCARQYHHEHHWSLVSWW